MAELVKESTGYLATEKLWLTADGKIVKDGDARAAQLLAPAGGHITLRVAERFGITKGAKVEPLEKTTAKLEIVFGSSTPTPTKTASTEEIAARSTRPEHISRTR